MIYSSLLYIDFWHGGKQRRDIKCNSMGPEMGLILPNIFRTDQIKLDSNPELESLTHCEKEGTLGRVLSWDQICGIRWRAPGNRNKAYEWQGGDWVKSCRNKEKEDGMTHAEDKRTLVT